MLDRFLADLDLAPIVVTTPYGVSTPYDPSTMPMPEIVSPPPSDILPLESPALSMDFGSSGPDTFPWDEPPPAVQPVPSIAISLTDFSDPNDPLTDFLSPSSSSYRQPEFLNAFIPPGLQVPDFPGSARSLSDGYASDISSLADASEIIEQMSAMGDTEHLDVENNYEDNYDTIRGGNQLTIRGNQFDLRPTSGGGGGEGTGTTTLEELAASLKLAANPH
ncbi:hypothetical protein HDV00_005142 [Rhizophlyctis rosea]|nr:hypothetical protein HDV00_005142 [Rhizophlyctis rosea]